MIATINASLTPRRAITRRNEPARDMIRYSLLSAGVDHRSISALVWQRPPAAARVS
jgi:hypothetical protein